LAAGVLRFAQETGGVPRGVQLRDFTLAGDDLSGLALQQVQIEDVEFHRCNLRSLSVQGHARGSVSLAECVFDDHTRIDLTGDPVLLLSAIDLGRELHSPRDLAELARRVGLMPAQQPEGPSGWNVSEEIMNLLERIARRSRRSNLLFEDDDYIGPLIRDDVGRSVMSLLTEAGVVRAEGRDKSGPATVAYRLLVNSEALTRSLSRVDDIDPRLAAGWRSLEQRFPASA